MKSLNRALAKGVPFAPIAMRIILGGYLIWRGFDKFNTGMENVEGFFASEGVPLAAIAAPGVAIAEIVIGLALVLGIGTRIAAIAQILILIGALIFVKFTPAAEQAQSLIARSEIDFIYIAGLIGVALMGPGAMSVDNALNVDDTVIDLRSTGADRVAANV